MVDISKYKKMFVDEAIENISMINDTLIILEQKNDDRDAIQTLFRAFHSIKGMSASMNYRQLQETSHKLEDILDGLRSGKIKYSQEILNILYDGAGVLEEMVGFIDDDSEGKVDTTALMDRIISIASDKNYSAQSYTSTSSGEKKTYGELSQPDLARLNEKGKFQYKVCITISKECISPSARAYLLLESLKMKSEVIKTIPPKHDINEGKLDGELFIYINSELSRDEVESIIRSSVEIEKYSITKIEVASAERVEEPEKLYPRSAPKDAKVMTPQYRKPGAVKVETEVMDTLIDIVGEMFIEENQLQDIVRLRKSTETFEIVNKLEKLLQKLYKQVMTIRLVPISLLTDMFPRIIHEALRGTDKKVELEITGKDIKLDRSIIEKLGDPMIHLIRNSIDHGIESPQERIKAGKPGSAKISFIATKERDSIRIEFSDDGAGLNEGKIKEKIIENKLARREAIEKADLKDIYEFIWDPGFSTAGQVTSISGRGVGMDIVKSTLEGLGGKISVASTSGQGCTFQLQVPLTIAIIKTFRIVLDQDIYAVPIGKVVRTVEVSKSKLKTDEEGMHFYYREEKIPVKDLKTIFNYGSCGLNGKDTIPILVVESGVQEKTGLIVDSFLPVFDTVVKSLGSPLEKLEAFSGATISEKGELVLIIDVDRIIISKEKK